MATTAITTEKQAEYTITHTRTNHIAILLTVHCNNVQ